MHGTIGRLKITFILFFLGMPIASAAGGKTWLDFQVFRPDESYFPFATFPQVPAYLAVRSAADWVAFWRVPGRLSPPAPMAGRSSDMAPAVPNPDVDFDRFTLLFVTMGPMGVGHSTTISSILDMGSKIRITVINASPGFDSGCTRALGMEYPTATALIPKTDKPIVFDIIEATANGCRGHREIASGE
jgi:hypothetical protein